MSDTSYNVTTNRAANESGSVPAGSGGGGGGGSGTLGGYQKVLTFNLNSTPTTTSATFVDVTGEADQTIITPVSGEHIFEFSADIYSSAVSTQGELQLLIDGVTAVPLGIIVLNGASEHHKGTFFALASLTPGSHTVRPQWRRVSGSGTVTADNAGKWFLLIQGQGSGINGLELSESTFSANATISSVFPTFADISGLSTLSVTTLANETIEISLVASAQQASGAGGSMYLAYQLDSGADIPINYLGATGGTNSGGDISFSMKLTIPTAGTHSIKLRASCDSGRTFTIHGSTTGAVTPKFQVTRYKASPTVNGTTKVENTLAANFTVTAASPTYADTGLDVVVNTVANEEVTIQFIGSGRRIAGAGLLGLYLALQIDGGSDDKLFFVSEDANNSIDHDISFAKTITLATAGAHTIKLRASTDSGSTWRINGSSSVTVPTFQAVQHRAAQATQNSFVGSIQTSQSINGSNADFANTGFSQVNSVQCAITTTVANEVVEVSYSGNVQFLSTNFVSGQLGYSIDGATTVVGWYEDRPSGDVGGIVRPAEWTTKATIATPGSHTIRFMAKESGGGGGTMRVLLASVLNQAAFQVTQFGGGAKLVQSTRSATAIQNTSITSTSYIDIGSAVSIVTVPNETVLLSATISSDITSGTFATDFISLAYSLDGAAEVLIWESRCPANGIFRPSAFILPVQIATGGAHSIKLRTKVSAGTFRIFDSGIPSSFAVTQFGGDNQATSWTAFTPTGSWTTNTTYTGFHRKVGDTLECRVQVALSGAPTATTLQVNLPAGFTIDTAKVLSTTALEGLFGEGYCLDTGVTQKEIAQVNYWTTTAVALTTVVSGSNAVQQVSNTAPFTFGNTDKVWLNFSVPVL